MSDIMSGRSPRGERGLKYRWDDIMSDIMSSLPSRGAWIEINSLGFKRFTYQVAPLAGSVD